MKAIAAHAKINQRKYLATAAVVLISAVSYAQDNKPKQSPTLVPS